MSACNRLTHKISVSQVLPRAVVMALVAIALLSGCAIAPTEKRHTPAEIAAYKPADFVATIASAEGERVAREESMQRIRDALALPAGFDPNGIVPGALWNIGFLNTERENGLRLVLNALPLLAEKDAAYQRAFCQLRIPFLRKKLHRKCKPYSHVSQHRASLRLLPMFC